MRHCRIVPTFSDAYNRAPYGQRRLQPVAAVRPEWIYGPDTRPREAFWLVRWLLLLIPRRWR
jgi:nucleoside-diphosphate-sugar epimerase